MGLFSLLFGKKKQNKNNAKTVANSTEGKDKTLTEEKAEPKATAAPAAKEAQKTAAQPAPKAEPKATAAPAAKEAQKPVAQPAPKAEPKATAAPAAKEAQKPVAQPAPKAEPKATAAPVAKEAQKTAAQPAPKAEPKATAAPAAKEAQKTAAQPAPKAEPKATAAPAAKEAQKPVAQPAPKAEPKAAAVIKEELYDTDKADEVTSDSSSQNVAVKGYGGAFEIKKSKDGRYVFNLFAANHVIIATSQIYSSAQSAMVGIKSVIANAEKAAVEDQTLTTVNTENFPKWEIYTDKSGQFRFRLLASNGSCVCHSQGYTKKAACKNGIESIIRTVKSAEIDKAYLKKQ